MAGRSADRSSHRITRQAGFGMFEVLIAVFVLTVGMLGVAALQTQGLRAGQTAGYRTLAVIKAREIVERIRANPDSVLLYQVTADSAGVNAGCDDGVGGAIAVPCDSADMAAHDLFRWKESLRESMPEGNATVDIDPATVPPTVTVTVTWTERDGDLTYTMETQI